MPASSPSISPGASPSPVVSPSPTPVPTVTVTASPSSPSSPLPVHVVSSEPVGGLLVFLCLALGCAVLFLGMIAVRGRA